MVSTIQAGAGFLPSTVKDPDSAFRVQVVEFSLLYPLNGGFLKW